MNPSDHRLVPLRGFSELKVGEVFNLPSRTIGEANFAAFQAVSLDNQDRKSTRLNSSHMSISYAVFCLKKKKHFKPLIQNTNHITYNYSFTSLQIFLFIQKLTNRSLHTSYFTTFCCSLISVTQLLLNFS